jgi:hypothetical protein
MTDALYAYIKTAKYAQDSKIASHKIHANPLGKLFHSAIFGKII